MKTVLRIIGGLLLLIVLLVAISALSNLGLPTESSVVDQLGEADKARVAEMYHLRAELGN